MKKRWILPFALVCFLLMFVLFHEPAHPVTVPDNVVAVEMPDYGGTQLYSTSRYTSPEKVQAILDALSAMDPRGDPIDLQLTGGTGLIVVLQTADGEQAIYEVFDGRWDHYFYMGQNNDWYAVSRRKCNDFYALLDELEPDGITINGKPADPAPSAEPESTAAEKFPYSSLIENPKAFTYTAAEGDTPETAALALATLYMEDLTQPSDERTFRITKYRGLTVERVVPTRAVDAETAGLYFLLDSEIAANTWLVEFYASYQFEGTVSPVGPMPKAEDGAEDIWIFPLYQGSTVGFLMTKTGSEYTLRSRWS